MPEPEQMLRVAGLTVSLPTTRLAIITRRVNGVCIASASSITGTGKRVDTLADRWARIVELSNEILHAVVLTELVVIEDPGTGARGTSALDRHGLWWAVMGSVLSLGVPIAVCTPAARPQGAATGLAGAITPMWPHTRLSAPQDAGALALAHMGAIRLGWDVPGLPAEEYLAALGGIVWPDAVP